MFDVPHFFAHEVTNYWPVNLPHQVRRENKTSIQRYDHVHSPSGVLPRNLFAQGRHARVDARRGKCRSLSTAQIFSSAITRPVLVLSFAANSAATGKLRAHTRLSPLVSTGQPSRSHRLTCFSFSKRFSLWELRWPMGRKRSPGRQLRSTIGKRNRSRSRTTPSLLLVSPLWGGQSITLRRNTHPSSATLTSAWPPAKSISYSYSCGVLRKIRTPLFSMASNISVSRSFRTSTPPGSESELPLCPLRASSSTAST